MKTKIPPTSIDEMEEDDRKILEMFNCFKDSYIICDNFQQEEHCKEIKRKKEKKLIEKSKNNAKKKLIFKIEKISKKMITTPQFDVNDPKFQNDLIYFNKEISNLVNTNENIIFRLLDCYTVEENTQNLMSWLESNPNFEDTMYFQNLRHQPFIQTMNEILNKWNNFCPLSEEINKIYQI